MFARRYPRRYECAGENNVRMFVYMVLKKARLYGCRNARHTDLVSRLMVYFGCGFDEDPLYPWAAACRASAESTSHGADHSAQLYALHNHLLEMYRYCRGADGEYTRQALSNLMSLDVTTLLHAGMGGSILELLARIWPRRFEYCLSHPNAQHQLLRLAREKAQRCKQHHAFSSAAYACLMFTCGVQADEDPLCAPARTLAEGRVLRNFTWEKRALTTLQGYCSRILETLEHKE